jgi:hypothetical protein
VIPFSCLNRKSIKERCQDVSDENFTIYLQIRRYEGGSDLKTPTSPKRS